MNGNKLSTMMKKSYIYTVVLSCIALVSGCVDIEEFEEPAQKVSKTFYAEMEDSPLTKTVLGDKGEDGIRPVLWMPEDKIGVAPSTGGTFDMFVNKSAESSVMAEFEGQTSLASSYFAVYPYDKDAVVADGSISFTLNTEQKYKAGSFDEGAFPMIARSSDTNDDGLMFYNLCGVLEVNLTGEEKITKISFSSNNKVSGKFSVNANYEQYPEMVADASSLTSTTLDCGEGVQLKADSPTPFYFVLPPGTYDAFTLMIHTSDGKMMFKQSQKPLAIKRSTIIKSGALAYVESVSIDLSIRGTANSYVVSGAGMYSFDASVIGNGSYGIVSGASFHTEDPKITPASVEVLWESTGAGVETSKGKLLTSVSLIDGRIHFISTGVEGNALVAVKDNNGTILWSWHLWFTDTPKDQLYVNSVGTFTVQDRNLGATRADRGTGDEWKDAKGVLYQWGRKDPFIFYDSQEGSPYGDRSSSRVSIESTISSPTTFYGGSRGWETTRSNVSLWLPSQKTIYDPCPVGYKVAQKEIWKDFSKTGTDVTNLSDFNVSGSYDKGWDFYYDATNSTYIPATDLIHYNYTYEHRDHIGDLWSSEATQGTNAYRWNYEYYGDWGSRLQLWYSEVTAFALATRCMKDDGHVDLALPVVEMVGAKDATAESVSLTFNVVNAGASSVTESGIIYSTTPGVSTGNGQKVVAAGSEYKVDLTGLTEGTRYYAVAYATNSFGTSYSKEITFYTEFANFINLSKFGTSNCYIVSKFGAYTFDASVKGNGNAAISSGESAEVVWETKNTDASVEVGEIVRNVTYEAGFINFVATGVPGNALIAVKNSSGTIIWNWHIWVCDFDPYTTANTYFSGAVMMDRNLGALNSGGDASSYGFLYQWGRKDPLLGSANGGSAFATTAPAVTKEYVQPYNPFEYSFANPTHAVGGLENESSSWGRVKTIYDPCPPGWRVPDGGPDGVWTGMVYGSPGIEGGTSYGKWTINPPYSTPATIYPAPGYTVGDRLELYFPGSALYCWSCDVASSSYAYGMHLFDRIETELTSNKGSEFSVRCMREHDINVLLNTEQATEVTKTSANIHGSMGYLGAANLLEMGFVWSSTNESPDVNSSKIVVDVKEGEFSKSLTNLSPGTTYYVRTFATEGNITIYGNVVSFTTQVSAGNEDIPEDDEYDW